MKHEAKKLLERIGLLRPAFRLQEALRAMSPAASGRRPGPDGLPLPPGKLIVQVFGQNNAAAFLEGGRQLAACIREILQLHDLRLEDFRSILDFGCGSGRVIRHLQSVAESTHMHGTDYNAEMVGWCNKNLPFARFQHNDFLPPLGYADGFFDFVYAVSVFTHLTEPVQLAWMRELARVIRPGGYLLITVHGASFIEMLTPAEQTRFQAGELVVRYDSAAGTNLCAAFHPAQYLERLAQGEFSIAQKMPRQGEQDLILFQRLAA